MSTKPITVRAAFQAMENDQLHGPLWLNGRAIGDIEEIEPDYFVLAFYDGGDDAVEGGTEIEEDS